MKITIVNDEKAKDIRRIFYDSASYGVLFDSPKDAMDWWEKFSESYCAMWLGPDEQTIKEFCEYVKEKEAQEYVWGLD